MIRVLFTVVALTWVISSTHRHCDESLYEVRYSPDFLQLPAVPTNKESIRWRYDITSLVKEKRLELRELLQGTDSAGEISSIRVFLRVLDEGRVIYVDLRGGIETDGRFSQLSDEQFKRLKALLFTLIPERPPID